MANRLSGTGGCKGKDKEPAKDVEEFLKPLMQDRRCSNTTPSTPSLLTQLQDCCRKGPSMEKKGTPSLSLSPSPTSDGSFPGIGGGGASTSPPSAGGSDVESRSGARAPSKPPRPSNANAPASGPIASPQATCGGRATASVGGNRRAAGASANVRGQPSGVRKRNRKSNKPTTVVIKAGDKHEFKEIVQTKTGLQNSPGPFPALQIGPPQAQPNSIPFNFRSDPPAQFPDSKSIPVKAAAAPVASVADSPAVTVAGSAPTPPEERRRPAHSSWGYCVSDPLDSSHSHDMNYVMGFSNSVPHYLQDEDHSLGRSTPELLDQPFSSYSQTEHYEHPAVRKCEDLRDVSEEHLDPVRTQSPGDGRLDGDHPEIEQNWEDQSAVTLADSWINLNFPGSCEW